jgi:four helix bundle protein
MKRFGLAVIHLTEKFPPGRVSSIIANQLIRAGTPPGANYRAACRARSRADFIFEMGIVEEELGETTYWLEIARDAGLIVCAHENVPTPP